jgi:hypothetical protein
VIVRMLSPAQFLRDRCTRLLIGVSDRHHHGYDAFVGVSLHRRADVDLFEEQHAVSSTAGVHLGMQGDRPCQRSDHKAGP